MKKFLGLLIKKIYKGLMILVYRPKVVGRENMPKDSMSKPCPCIRLYTNNFNEQKTYKNSCKRRAF